LSLEGQVPESVLDRDQYICNRVHSIYAFEEHEIVLKVSVSVYRMEVNNLILMESISQTDRKFDLRALSWISWTSKRNAILSAAKAEIMRHRWDTFVDRPPSVAEGGQRRRYTRLPAMQEAIESVGQFMDHLGTDVRPPPRTQSRVLITQYLFGRLEKGHRMPPHTIAHPLP